jgi:hypothetical protein
MAVDRQMEDTLNRVVAGLTALLLDFDGPRTAYIGTDPSVLYVTLCSHGIKEQGDSAPSFGWVDAIEKYAEHLQAMIGENKGKQLAWRERPSLSNDGLGKFRVYSRLAFI